MRKVLLLLLSLSLFAAACTGEPETVSIRLIDGFESGMVQGSPMVAEPERTEWRFDGEGTLPALEEAEEAEEETIPCRTRTCAIARREAEDGEEVDEGEATFGWTAINDIEGLEVRDGMLVGTTGALPILLGVRPGELDESDVLYAVEIRMRVSEGTEVGIQFNGARERDDDWVESRIEQLTDQPTPSTQGRAHSWRRLPHVHPSGGRRHDPDQRGTEHSARTERRGGRRDRVGPHYSAQGAPRDGSLRPRVAWAVRDLPGDDDGVPLTVEGGGSGESPC